MHRLLPVLVVLALLGSACGGRGEVVAATPPPEPSPTASPTPSPTPEPEPELAPLTGMPVEDADALARPVAALKIDNHVDARPQAGLELADVVIEELVEGGATRFIALYHSLDPGAVGPVRSGRDVDADLLPPFTPVLGISGAAGPVYPVLRGAGLLVFEEGQANGAFYRQSGRRSPHNLFATVERLWGSAADLSAPEPPWTFDGAVPDGGVEAPDIRMSFSAGWTAGWEWDARRASWLRSQMGRPHVSEEGSQIDAENVVVVRVPVGVGNGVDSGGGRTAHISVIGEGDAVLFRDGQAYEVRWTKPSRDEHFTFLTQLGRPLPFAPGRTWLELLPVGAPLDYEVPDSGATLEE